MVHIDVMDGHFVPNITIGAGVTAALRKVTDLPLDCHLMIAEPDRHVDDFVEAGADMISVHVEAATHLHRTVQRIRERGVKAGVVLNPATPLSALDEILPEIDFVLLMSVNPGFGGQKLIPSVLQKARAMRQRLDREAPDVRLEIDGGVTVDNVADVAACCIDMIVTGSAVFGSGDIRGTTERMVRQLAELAERERTC